MLVKDLKPRMNVDELVLEIVSKQEPREFANDRGQGKVCNAAGKDSEGAEISLTLWNEDCDKVNEGDKIKIIDGWTKDFRGTLQVGAGRNGKIEVVKE